MASHKKEPQSPSAEDPNKHDDDPEQSLAHYATTVGIVTGLFGMLSAVGLILLPSETIREKILVIAASLAVSVAGLTGVGAWRSRRKFGLTALAGGLAIVCLAALSFVAASGVRSAARATPRGSSGAQPGASRKIGPSKTPHGASPSGSSHPTIAPSSRRSPHPTPSVSTGPSPAVDPIYLSELTGDPGSDQGWVAPIKGPQSINNTEYRQSLGYRNLCTNNTSVIYHLGRPYKNLVAEVGLADGWSAEEDNGTEATFTVDAGTGAGAFTLVTAATAEGGRPSLLDTPLPTGTTELELTTKIMDGCMQDSTVVWGNARVVP